MKDMEIFKGIKVINGFPAIFIERLNALAIADLHLGYELALAEEGVFIPQTQLKEILKDLKEIFRKIKAKSLIIVGDVKHEFGEASVQEWRETYKLTEFLKRKVEEVVLVRGNHDNYLLNIISRIGMNLYDPYYLADDICFVHGHRKIKLPKFKTLIIGHEHPSLVLREGYDKIKTPCLLYGKTKKNENFICLPAISFWASGTEVNLVSRDELLSPILREDVVFENLIPVALDKETGALKFLELSKLRGLKKFVIKENIHLPYQ